VTTTTTDLVTPEGLLILPVDAPREEWLEARRLGIGGSDALAALGMSQYSSRYSVWADKRGLLPDSVDNEAMKWGRRLEPIVAEAFTEETGIGTAVCGLMRHVDRDWQLASVDRLTEDGAVLEIKTTSSYRAGDWDDDQIADAAEAQLQHYLAVTGLEHGYAAALIGGQRLEIRHVQRDERLIALMVEAEAELWHLVEAGTAPALDGSQATADALAHLYPWAEEDLEVELSDEAFEALGRYVEVGKQIEALKVDKGEARNILCAELGEAMTGTRNGKDVVTWKNVGHFDEDLLRTSAPDIVAEFTEQVTISRLARKALAAAHPDIYAAHRGRRFNPIRKAL